MAAMFANFARRAARNRLVKIGRTDFRERQDREAVHVGRDQGSYRPNGSRMSLVSRIARRIVGPAPASGRPEAAIALTDPSIAANPYPHYEALRAQAPVLYLPGHHAWILLGFDEVKAAFAQPEIFSSAPYQKVDAVLLAADPPHHEKVRRLVARRFTPRLLDDLAGFAEARVAELLVPELDVAGDYAAPLTQAVAARLIGFDAPTLAQLHAVMTSRAAGDPLDDLIPVLDSIAPRADCFADLAAAVGEADARSLVRLLWLGATISSERVIVRSVLCLLENPEMHAAITGDPLLLPAFVDEVTRLHPPELMEIRRTTRDVSLGGTVIPAGALVRLCVAAANRDPAKFDEPHAFRLDRSFRRQFSFGGGIHHCLGAPLARRVVAAALAPFVAPGRRLRAAEPIASIPWHLSLNACAPTRLRVLM
jgi:cytochrome P450